MFNIFKPITSEEVTKANPFAYRLTISLEPNWSAILGKLLTEKEHAQILKVAKMVDGEEYWWNALSTIYDNHPKHLKESNLYNKRYRFIEYYDSVSGLTSKTQYITDGEGNQKVYDVDEFKDGGMIFYDGDFRISLEKNPVFWDYFHITESSIADDKGNTLFKVPINQIVNFLFLTRTLFKDKQKTIRTDGKLTVVKFPISIENKLNEYDIKVSNINETGSDSIRTFDLKDWVVKNKPQMLIDSQKQLWLEENLFSSEIGTNGDWYLSLNGVATMSIKLDIFYPEKEASRIDF